MKRKAAFLSGLHEPRASKADIPQMPLPEVITLNRVVAKVFRPVTEVTE